MDSGTCRGCGAVILWATTKAGKKVPLEKPEPRYVVQMLAGEERVVLVQSYVPHHAVCPNAAEFRKKKEGAHGQEG